MGTMRCLRVNLGMMDFSEVWQLQKQLARLRMAGDVDDLLLFVEHPPVITIGRAGDAENIRVPLSSLEGHGIALVEVDRGGDVTYHGPGQLVGYPILDLTRHGKDLHLYTYNLEEHLIQLLATYGIHAGRIPGLVGVWVGGEKVAGIICERETMGHYARVCAERKAANGSLRADPSVRHKGQAGHNARIPHRTAGLDGGGA